MRNGAKACGLALAAVGLAAMAGWAWAWHEASALRAEMTALRAEKDELRSVRAENARLRAQQISAEEMAALRARGAAAQRLQGEIADLKKRADVVPSVGTRRTMREAVEERYAGVFGKLGLTAEQAERLRALLVRRAQAVADVVDTARRGGRDPNRLATRQEAARARMDVEWQIRHELGEVRYAMFQDFEWEQSARRVVRQAEAMLARTPTPLRPEQTEALTPIVARARSGGVLDPLRPEAYQIRLDEEAMRAAAAVLSPEQMRALEFIRKGIEKPGQ